MDIGNFATKGGGPYPDHEDAQTMLAEALMAIARASEQSDKVSFLKRASGAIRRSMALAAGPSAIIVQEHFDAALATVLEELDQDK